MNNKRNPATGRSDPDEGSGHVRFDHRGNADSQIWRGHPLEHPELALADEQPPRNTLKTNGAGLKSGYDPYDSGMLAKKAYRRRKDLRTLSKWIESKKNRPQTVDD
ncbi:MAG: hypothetical protein ACRETX_12370 [Steroidobacteraceae bacterium]